MTLPKSHHAGVDSQVRADLPPESLSAADTADSNRPVTIPPRDEHSREAADGLVEQASEQDRSLAIIIRTVAAIGVVDAVAVGYFAGRGAGASAAYGATLALGNLLLLGRMVRAFFGRGGASLSWVVAALTKLAVLLVAMYVPVRAGLVQVLPFIFGFGALPLGIVLGQLLSVPPKSKEN